MLICEFIDWDGDLEIERDYEVLVVLHITFQLGAVYPKEEWENGYKTLVYKALCCNTLNGNAR